MTVFESWSVSHAAAVLLALSIAAGAAFAFKPRKRNRRVSRPAWREIDYSAQRAKAIEWLGEDYLLAKPVNRHFNYDLSELTRVPNL